MRRTGKWGGSRKRLMRCPWDILYRMDMCRREEGDDIAETGDISESSAMGDDMME